MTTGRCTVTLARALLIGSLILAGACSNSPTAPPPFDILSPASDSVSVMPGGSVRFEVRVDPGIKVEYLVDGAVEAQGPVFVFEPTRSKHTVTTIVESTGPATVLLEKDFFVEVEVPGNMPPQVVSIQVENGLEALRDSVHAKAVARDPDGSLEQIEIDFGDGSRPEVSSHRATVLEAAHVYQDAGSYLVTVTVTDSVQISSSDSTRIQVVAPNQLPTGSLTVQGATKGEAPLSVRLVPSGNDPDGTIVSWELDTGDGTFDPIQPDESVAVDYQFRESAYQPRLRLTDNDGDSAIFVADASILVFRSIDVQASSVDATGNSFLSQPGNPIIWADGNDQLTFSVRVLDPEGGRLEGVPVRFTSTRPALTTPAGSSLGETVEFDPRPIVETNSNGLATAFLRTDASTRVESVPVIGSVPFTVKVEVSRGHGEWVAISTVKNIEASSIVDGRAGGAAVMKLGGGGYCAGDVVEVIVRAVQRSGAPASGVYAELRYAQLDNKVWFGALPGPENPDWRTDGNGEVRFRHTVTPNDKNRVFTAWVDGTGLVDLGLFNFKAGC